MRTEAYKEWLRAASQKESSVSSRTSDIRRVEGQYGDLDEVFSQGRTEELLASLRYSKSDKAANKANPTRLVIDGDIYNSLNSYRAAIASYQRFCTNAMQGNVSQADRIRWFTFETVIIPARVAGESEVEVITGDIHREMGLLNAVPAVCSALGGSKFLQIAQLRLLERRGPHDSSTVCFRYALDGQADCLSEARPKERTMVATNLILYGPPGTGKTFATAREAVRLCDSFTPVDELQVRIRYNELLAAGQVKFVTFHQSYSYEDFIEGLRPTTGEEDTDSPPLDGLGRNLPQSGGFSLKATAGIFREIASVAEQAMHSAKKGLPFDMAGRRVFKMSLGRAGIENQIFEAAIEGDYIALGWGGEIDWTPYESYEAIHSKWNEIVPNTNGNNANIAQTARFRVEMQKRDLVVISSGNSRFRAVAEVVGPYEFKPTADYMHRRAVKWLFVPKEPMPITFYNKPFMQKSCYLLSEDYLNRDALALLLPGSGENKPAVVPQFVLICDEINRANISKVFGELITLIEPDKRIGAEYELFLTLPYSKQSFGVPANLHIVGTMNTADRSIALLDTALRRRFVFKEVMPNSALLSVVDNIDLGLLLTKLNNRIEYLFDREHQIGHAYLMGCSSRAEIDANMQGKIIPLLAEYFHEDWSKIAAVLGDTRGERLLIREKLLAPDGMEGEYVVDRYRWRVRESFELEAYAGLQ